MRRKSKQKERKIKLKKEKTKKCKKILIKFRRWFEKYFMNLIFTKSLHSAEGKKVNQLFMQRGFFPKGKHENRFYDILDPS